MKFMDLTLDALSGPSVVGKTAEDPRSTAISYLEKHGILRLMQLKKLVYEIALFQPDDPIQYMIDHVENIGSRIDY
ncbi:transcription factor mrg-related [Schistosoma japonicum]|nr:transcription factor mrg-related [Schistosoma japonicum]